MRAAPATARVRLQVVLLAGIAALALAATAIAGDGTIAGSVVDGDGRPLAAVEVAARGPRPALVRTAATDERGSFRLAGLSPGRYRVSFELPGHQWLEVRDLEVGVGAEVVLAATLRAAEGDELVLRTGGPMVEATSAADAVTRDAGSLAPLPGGPVAVSLLPGAVPAVDDRWQAPGLSILGEPAAPVRLSVDGLELVERTAPPAVDTVGWRAERLALPPGRPASGDGALRLASQAAGVGPAGSLALGWSEEELSGVGRSSPTGRAPWVGLDDRRSAALGFGSTALEDRLGVLATLSAEGCEERLRLTVAGPGGAAVEHQDRRRRRRTLAGSLRLDWRPRPAKRLDLLVLAGEERVAGEVADLFVVDVDQAAETGFDRRDRELGLGLRFVAVLGRDWFASAWVGRSTASSSPRPWSTAPSLQDQTLDGRFSHGVGDGAFTGGAGFAPFDDHHELRRAGVELEAGRGRHLLRLGVDRRESVARRSFPATAAVPVCLPVAGVPGAAAAGGDCGAGLAVDLSGARVRLREEQALLLALDPSWSAEYRLSELALWVGDRWRPRPDLGLEVGLRAAVLELEGGAESTVRLREGLDERLDVVVGVVWDPEGLGRSRLFLHGARRHRLPAVDPDRGPLATDPWRRIRLAGEGPAAWAAGPPGQVVEVSGPPILEVAPGTGMPTALELAAGAEGEVLGGLAVGLVLHYRSGEDGPVRVVDPATGQWWLAGAGAVLPFLGDDGRPARLPPLCRTLRAAELRLRKRLGDGWQAEVSVAHQHSKGAAASGRGAAWERLEGPLAVEPFRVSDLEGARGPMPGERPWQVRALGSYTFAGGLVAGATGWWASGAPLERLGASSQDLRLDQRPLGGAGRGPSTWQVDLRLAQPVALGAGVVELGLEIRNLFDRQAALRGDPRWSLLEEGDAVGLDTAEQRTSEVWGAALVRQPPRTVELGLRYRW